MYRRQYQYQMLMYSYVRAQDTDIYVLLLMLWDEKQLNNLCVVFPRTEYVYRPT